MGEFRHALDPKKRLTIPSEWREQFGDEPSLVVLPGMNRKCLMLLPASDVARRVQNAIQSRSLTDARSRQVASRLGSMGSRLEWDGQGRIRVKDELMALAGLSSEVVLVGALDVIELWSPENWAAENNASDAPSLGDAAREIGF
jgi:MraZ protein